MSQIPNAAMPHAKTHDDHASGSENKGKAATGTATKAGESKPLGERATELTGTVTDAIKSHPKTAIGVGAAVVAGIAAAVAGPAIAAKVKESSGKKSSDRPAKSKTK